MEKWKLDWKVCNEEHADVTDHFVNGAITAFQIARTYDAKIAILKTKSPSCGVGMIYDGNFNHTLVPGNGVSVHLFMSNGILVIPSSDIE